MALSADLVSQLLKATKTAEKRVTEATVYGTAVEQEGGSYVQLDGSDVLTPVSTTVKVKSGDRVIVRLKDHSATVTGNLTSRAANGDDIEQVSGQITDVEILVADQISATNGRIDTLVSDNVVIKESLTVTNASIENLTAGNVAINEKLNANEAAIENLKATSLTADIADLKYATIGDLEATNAQIYNLEVAYGDFRDLSTDKFTAIEADIKRLDADKISATDLDAEYANIDFANIGEAAIETFFAKSGMIDDLVFSEGRVTGTLVGVTIIGDYIKGGTIQADKLVIQGEDGLYYRLNIEGGATVSEQVSEEDLQNGLSGTIIVAKSITAEKVAVDDLVAFGATIGGFHITDDSLYSGAKNSVGNTTEGVYLDSDGQVAFGDSSNYLKYYKTANGSRKLEIAASSIKLGTSGKDLESELNNPKKQYLHIKYSNDGKTFTEVPNAVTLDISLWESGVWVSYALDRAYAVRYTEAISVTPGSKYSLLFTAPGYTFSIAEYASAELSSRISGVGYNSDTSRRNGTLSDTTNYIRVYIQATDNTATFDTFQNAFESGDITLDLNIGDLSAGDVEGAYVGMLVDYNETASTNFDDYTWQKAGADSTADITDLRNQVNAHNDRLNGVDDALSEHSNRMDGVDTTLTEHSGRFDEVNQTISDQSAAIIAESEGITLEALKHYTESSEFETYKESTDAQLKLLSDEMTLKFTETSNRINAENEDLRGQLDTITKYFTFNINGMTIGKVDNPKKIVIDNDDITISVNDNIVQQFDADGNSLIPSLQVTTLLNIFGYGIDRDENGMVSCSYVGIPVRIIRHPQDLTLSVNTKGWFTVAAEGEGSVSYQWQYRLMDSDEWKNCPDITYSDTDSYPIIPSDTTVSGGTLYRCVVTDETGAKAYSKTATCYIK